MSLHSPSQATLWQTLLPAAMVGTDKKTVAAPLLDGAVGALLAQVQAQAAQPALALLQMAGVLAVCERAGWQGQAPATPGSGAAACARKNGARALTANSSSHCAGVAPPTGVG